MTKYPLVFNATTNATSGLNTTWESNAFNQLPLTVAIPKEFEGEGGGYSPEDLYLLALTNCFVATFKFAAHKSALTFRDLKVETKLIVDLDGSGRPIMKEFYLDSYLSGASHTERAQRLLTKIEGSCLILNSVKTKVIFHHHLC